MRNTAPASQRGFVLVAALWVLAALVVLAAYIDAVATAEVERATRAKAALQRGMDRRSLENTLLYMLATGRMNHRALVLEEQQRFADALIEGEIFTIEGDGELLLTGATYASFNGMRFAIQDEGGLVSVNAPHYPPFAATLAQLGVPRPAIVTLAARVADYIDIDQRLSLNGAEAFEYQRQNMAQPPNWPMVSPLELKRVLGVETLVSGEQWRRLRPLLTARPPPGYNFNTMHPQVLAGVLGNEEALPVLEARAEAPISGLIQLARLTGRQLDINATQLLSLPSRFLRISTWHADQEKRGGVRHVLGIELMPYGLEAPWQKDYRYTAPAMEDDAGTLSPQRAPLASERRARGSASHEQSPQRGSASGNSTLGETPLEAPTRLLQ